MKKKTSKYRILKGFENKMKAEKYLNELIVLHGQYADGNEGKVERFSLKERTWFERDKKRYYVRELVRKGVKK